jgi:squalene synthase HpnC
MADAVIADLPGAEEIYQRASGENFSVASLLVGRTARRHLVAIYGYARLVDQIGDAAAGDRPEMLDRFEADLDRIFQGAKPEHPVLRRLAPTVHELDLPRAPFARLIEANRRDQQLARYETYDELLGYCDLSANAVGELVLHVFGVATADRIALSDRICSALQLAEHWQDVAEDRAAGRIYLPMEDLARFEVAETDLDGATTGANLRKLIAFEVDRARELLDSGAPLVGRLGGRARIAVAGYVAGGRAALGAIGAAGHDVLPGPPRASKARRVWPTLVLLARGA